ncbi:MULTISPECIES: polysaccharide deacetylase family protein [Bacillus]|uniref:polysaccharide deacetylase family protein n=1 Tax=Bacillus TaxID=1386 RepID=UPI0012FEBBA7|nr:MULTISPECIES: polysaccharide deacetylase family protein [Bacillus]
MNKEVDGRLIKQKVAILSLLTIIMLALLALNNNMTFALMKNEVFKPLIVQAKTKLGHQENVKIALPDEIDVEKPIQTEEPINKVQTPIKEQEKPETSGEKEKSEEEKEKTPPPIKKETPQDGVVVYLTFDDGPTKATDHLITILADYNAIATFFMLEPQVQEFPQVVQRMTEEGHALALHGVTHSRQLFYASSNSVVGEMRKTQDAVEHYTGIRTNLIRTPFGSAPHMTPAYKKAVVEAGFLMWDWNVDSRDWAFRGPEYIAYTLQQVDEVIAKGENPVILLHDFESTVQHITILLDELVKRGVDFQPLTEEMTPIHLK